MIDYEACSTDYPIEVLSFPRQQTTLFLHQIHFVGCARIDLGKYPLHYMLTIGQQFTFIAAHIRLNAILYKSLIGIPTRLYQISHSNRAYNKEFIYSRSIRCIVLLNHVHRQGFIFGPLSVIVGIPKKHPLLKEVMYPYLVTPIIVHITLLRTSGLFLP